MSYTYIQGERLQQEQAERDQRIADAKAKAAGRRASAKAKADQTVAEFVADVRRRVHAKTMKSLDRMRGSTSSTTRTTAKATTTARARWTAAVKAKTDAGLSRTAAVKLVAKADPELRQQVIREANRGR